MSSIDQPVSSPSFSLEGRSAVVTGGGHGIGAAYCDGLSSMGASVVVADIDYEAARRVAGSLVTRGGSATAVEVDVSIDESARRMAEAADKEFGRIDILVNNAAVFSSIPISRGGFETIDEAEWDRVMTVNVRGVWTACRAVVPYMRRNGYGKIINISSGTALKSAAGRSHYVASKAAILGLTRTLATELGADNICVNAVAPGSTLSDENPSEKIIAMRTAAVGGRALRRVQVPDDLVGCIVFFASSASDFITGQTLVVDGGSAMH